MPRTTTSRLHTAFAACGVLAALAVAAPAQAALVYANDFDSAATVGAGVSASGLTNGSLTTALGSYAGSNGKTWARNVFINQSAGNPATMSTLTLTGLGAHSAISIDFMLGFLNSWDSTNGSVSPDFLDIFIDGNQVAQLTTANASGSSTQFGGGTQLVNNGQVDANTGWSDDLVDMGTAGFLSLAHSASTLTLSIRASGAGWQGGTDEYWGVDALRINMSGGNNVPEPATWGLVAVAGLAAAFARRRRTQG